MLTILSLNELRYDSKFVAVFADAAFNHIPDAEFFSDLPDVDSLALISEGGSTRDHRRVWESRKRRNNVFGYPVTQIAKVLIGAQIVKRKNRYGGYDRGDFWTPLLGPNLRIFLAPKLDLRRVRALREINTNVIALAVSAIIFAKLIA